MFEDGPVIGSVKELRVPPHSIPAERASIGSMLEFSQDAMALFGRILHGNAEAFYDVRHQVIAEACCKLHDSRKPIDIVTIDNQLRASEMIQQAGGTSYIAELFGCGHSGAIDEYHFQIVAEKWKARQLIEIADKVSTQAYDADAEKVEALIDQVASWSTKIGIGSAVKEKPVKEILESVIARLEKARKGVFDNVVKTGIVDFDRRFGGFNRGELHIIAGRPSAGKTAMMLQIARNMVAEEPVGLFSLEMTSESLFERMASSSAVVNLRNIQDFTDTDMRKLSVAMIKLAQSKFRVTDQSNLSIRQIQNIARQWVLNHGVRVLFVDYIQIAKGASKRSQDDRRLEIGEISAGLKQIAKELNVPVVALSQLNRSVERRGPDSKPRMSDLNESGSIEQDADSISFLWYKESNDDIKEQITETGPARVTMSIAKMRNGPTGDFDLLFDKTTQRFLPISRIPEDVTQNHP